MSRRIRGIRSSTTLLSRLKTLSFDLQSQMWIHASVKVSGIDPGEGLSMAPSREGLLDTSSWKIVDSRALGIKRDYIPLSAWKVLKTLQRNGFGAYLVGGCVRDLLLKRTPKDFDVITTASLKQIKKQFSRCLIIGVRFPICQVYISGDVVEVSSFSTTAAIVNKHRTTGLPQMSKNYNGKDLACWKDCMKRDFTINSLFFDPFNSKIYDYVDGIKDLRASKVRTVIPPHLSFKEDCARILRGMRIAARLGFQFSKETATAIHDLSSSILTLNKGRLMMEMNFMMAHGAAALSINILQKFKLLELLLPAHAAYLTSQSCKLSAESSVMLMKLLTNADKLLGADRPCNCNLWGPLGQFGGFRAASGDSRASFGRFPCKSEVFARARMASRLSSGLRSSSGTLAPVRASAAVGWRSRLGLLAFHLALVENPQDAIIIWTFSCVLCHGTWNKALASVKESSTGLIHFIPEIVYTSTAKPDELIFEETSHFISLVRSSIEALTDSEVLQQSLTKYSPLLRSQGLLFVSSKAGKRVSQLFNVIDTNIISEMKESENICSPDERKRRIINYKLLKNGDVYETRFVLGRIIMDTITGDSINEPHDSMPAREYKKIPLSALF